MIELHQLQAICKTDKGRAACAAYVEHLNSFMAMYGIDTPLREAMFLAQIAHESQDFTRVTENLNYSAQGLAGTWPKRYRGANSQPNSLAHSLHRNPQAIANNVYADRMGNGPEASGDGWRYRGRGLKQLTGKSNYSLAGKAMGLDLVGKPELLEKPEHAAESACWFWKENGLNSYADRSDVAGATRVINGGQIGLDERKDYYDRATEALGVTA